MYQLFLTSFALIAVGLAANTEDTVSDYLCLDECNVTRSRCSCMDECINLKNCCSDFQHICKGQSLWKDEECATLQEMICPNGFDAPPVILFSIDGFKSEYIYREETPNIWKLASCGVHAPYMRSVYPTTTFPNHYSMATGLYPESHGIIDNSMYDHEHNTEFYLGSPNTMLQFWWGGEPIWVTTSNQGLKSATYFWVGSDVNITRYPDYYKTYDGSVPNEERMYQALDWLDLPKQERPSFIALYLSLVDHTGHVHGPDSPEVNRDLTIADNMVGILMDGLKLRGLENCVNIMILADHGMAPISCERVTYVDKYGVDMNTVNFYGGAFGRVGKSRDENKWPEFDQEHIESQLSCQTEDTRWQVFSKQTDLPKRYHYANNKRIEEIQLVVDDEWLAGSTNTTTFCDGGMHGYDNEYKSMHALFTGHGPGFKRAYNISEGFDNIELYNLMADLLSITPAPNNGTPGSLYHIMTNPKQIIPLDFGDDVAVCIMKDTNVADDDLGCSYCAGLSEAEANQRLRNAIDNVDYNNIATPYGRPQVKSTDPDFSPYCLLTQQDYIMSYCMKRKMPYFVSYTLNAKNRNLAKPSSCNRPDIRIAAIHSPKCSQFNTNGDLLQTNLYPAELSNGDAVHDALIVTNTAPMYSSTATVWNYMAKVLADWSVKYGGINVIAGPAFDYNYDSLPDTTDDLMTWQKYIGTGNDTILIPSHFFIIVTRCLEYEVMKIDQCVNSPTKLEVLSWIVPNYKEPPCGAMSNQPASDWIPKTLKEHVARLRDVEILTGLSFLPKWTHAQNVDQETRVEVTRLRLRLPQFNSQWMMDFLNQPSSANHKNGVNSLIAMAFCVTVYMLNL
uniref:venom phosphodiesterase 2-like isoform X2 n=1 Tax=Ciona intestinalis TaxID=7719 RepID=UPI000180BCE1|nr:venom phosphodiesterase 2-like isoform X2 [Ciona intestinalis]|eukprot:XP_002120081.1 venom phosphodiesterase 2-like isoform X2 [Ciona intestinalis]